jgi:hypothetical protein
MSEIEISMCDEMAMAILEGVPDPETGQLFFKDWTTRTKKLGKIGDTFVITRGPLSKMLRLVEFKRMKLEDVARYGHRREGCVSAEDFIRLYTLLHPRAGFRPEALKWVHIFEEVRT